ncbi:hypothetical protein K3495_g6847 [Podosphaera aphanis]|nr:hypothetical protein K3495_g6847 [Podosphaera aphanis]
MSLNEQKLFDTLAGAPSDLIQLSQNVADIVDTHLNKVSYALRGVLQSSPWLPESVKPKPLPPPHKSYIPAVPSSLYSRLTTWVSKNKITSGVIVLSLGGLAYYVIRSKTNQKKRKAKRARDGSRLEVVILAGRPGDPFTRSISLDLERRGYVVYIVCATKEEEEIIRNETRADIKPLMIDIRNPTAARSSIDRFTAYLQSPHTAFPGAKQHRLIMRSLIMIPTTNFPTIPIATLAMGTLSDLLNSRFVQPIMTIQYFLPLLQSAAFAQSSSQSDQNSLDCKPSVLVLTPSIISSIDPAFHLPEASIISALASFTNVLEQELAPLSIPVTHLQLGTFDLSTYNPHNRQLTIQSQRAETLTWDEATRLNYGRNYTISTSRNWGRESNLRLLNSAVLDAMYSRHGGVMRVGSGSSIYGFVGKWVPRSIISWMMGLRKSDRGFVVNSQTCSSTTSGTDNGEVAKPPETLDLCGLKDEEAFRDADVWTSGFESNEGSEGFQSWNDFGGSSPQPN